MSLDRPPGRGACVGCSRRAADLDDCRHGVRAMAASALLLVDDDHDTCPSLSDVISDLGYRVGVAYDAPAALELPRQPPYGLALLDYKMPPGMGGVELYHWKNQTLTPGGEVLHMLTF